MELAFGILLMLTTFPAVLCDGTTSSPPGMCSVENFQLCTGSLPDLGRGIVPDVPSLADTCSSWTTSKPCLDTLTASCEAAADASDDDSVQGSTSMSMTTRSLDTTTGAWYSDNSTVLGNDTSEGTTDSVVHVHTDDVEEDLEFDRLSAAQGSQEMDQVFSFLCDSENMNEYNSVVRQCWNEKAVNLTRASDECHAAYYNDTWWLNRRERDNVYKYCKAATNYLTCQKKAGSNLCGSKFADWVWSYHRALWRPHMDDIECSPEGGMDAGAIAIISICSVAALLCIIFTVVAFIVKTPSIDSAALSAANRRPSSVSMTELGSTSNGKDTVAPSRNGSLGGSASKTVLAPAPEHGILKHRKTGNTEL